MDDAVEVDQRAPWKSLYPAQVPPVLHPRAPSMLEAWNHTVRRLTDAPGVYYFDQAHTFGELDRSANSLAAAFQSCGLEPGERVAIYLQNDPQWLVTMLAAWKCGAIAVAVNPMLRAAELSYHLRDAEPRILVCLDGLYSDVVKGIRNDTSIKTVVTTHPSDMLGAMDVRPMVKERFGRKTLFNDTVDWVQLIRTFKDRRPVTPLTESDAIAELTYTSGTTGRAKGAMNTHRGMVHSAQVYAEWFSLDSHDVVLGIAPLFHITGTVAGLGVTILTGAPIVLLHRFDPAETLRAIEERRATFTVAASTAYVALSNAPDLSRRNVSSLTKAGCGGAAVTTALVESVRDATGWHLRGVYGLTETTSPSHICPLNTLSPVDSDSGALSVGIPVPGARVRIVDVDTGVDVAPGAPGEVVIAGPMVVPGYWHAPAESANAIRDGRLFTGDIGIMNTDGWLFVIDRKKDLINAGGYKVWPREVEEALCQHPQVKEAAVIGIPDEYRGETVKAYISLVAGADVTADYLIEFCKSRIAAYKYPRVIEIIDEIPKTASGKILRRDLRALSSATAAGIAQNQNQKSH